ncbi:hypothetical protein EYF80_036111 [Liparis tanakae]|uniref:Uncharacterized protein n=1 Tax=Liparis tanakae TaxID=230148 RepID=A0A4Z2GKB3_9TELE|nr:hypothetical protein EYF80_036111 [Liparis tanakae]
MFRWSSATHPDEALMTERQNESKPIHEAAVRPGAAFRTTDVNDGKWHLTADLQGIRGDVLDFSTKCCHRRLKSTVQPFDSQRE